jgi:hypothetical protein
MTMAGDDDDTFDADKAFSRASNVTPLKRTVNVVPEDEVSWPDVDAYRDGAAMRKAKPKPRPTATGFPADELDSAKVKPKAGAKPEPKVEPPKAEKAEAPPPRPEEELRLATDVPYEMARMFLLYRHSHQGLVTLIYWRGDLLRVKSHPSATPFSRPRMTPLTEPRPAARSPA